MAVEEPKFTKVLQEGDFSVRDYPALVVAEVTMPGGQTVAAGAGFRALAGYIFGGNARRESMAMTAPVAQTPVAGGWVVRFFMPAGASLASLPPPSDPAVMLRVLPAERVAVLRFSGWARAGEVAAKSAELEALVRAHGLHGAGPVTLAQYNPPWTLWFMRRNEVMVAVAR
jgi:hypothetical protein